MKEYVESNHCSEATGEVLDSAKIDPDRQPDKRKHVEIQVKRNGQIVGKGW